MKLSKNRSSRFFVECSLPIWRVGFMALTLDDFMPFLSDYEQMLLHEVRRLGGAKNRHAHLPRAGLLGPECLAHVNKNPLDIAAASMKEKQVVVGDVLRGAAFKRENLLARQRKVLERLIWWGTVQIDASVDLSEDLPEDGLLALNVALELKKEFAGRIDLRVGAYPIFGISRPHRLEMFERAAEKADFLVTLPEKDDPEGKDGKIGIRRHFQKVLAIGCRLKKEVHFHLDQWDDPRQRDTEILLDGLGGWAEQPVIPSHDGPTVFAVHMISPTAWKSEKRYARLIDKILLHTVGVIVAFTAGGSMRRFRPIKAPSHNPIARVPELLKRGVRVFLGTDNIDDFFVPTGTGLLHREAMDGADLVRFYLPHVWAKLIAGVPLNNFDLRSIGDALYQDNKAFCAINPNWQSAVS
ncbi:MAG: hypothetical protein A2358_00075 [Candidatus Staskawiczbacteria bacterium RIFOXYB1_FULL_37_44]|uniref:Amidohydrolase-related domain-containing protein n=1 Tax=Candidatus Staskawiczbacteria bacterium RIFOXYB1_FULL_37_44 TaxID=1802223 RepID=A0A1G2IYE6_9BACT|nr:MAG: hypothetical protein A2358_00075 [Candidatus Staskawiczbacteria bacterium RIFOXYB1_FULL_37_44]OGZ90248.1 MAG: hypothetical protein A2581_02465 [Candidatus Staskawiczbacteria bacterium RIFOXYD1_FULL_37_110]